MALQACGLNHSSVLRAGQGFAGLFLALCISATASARPESKRGAVKLSRFQNPVAGAGYVGSKACNLCHPDIYQEYLRTSMGRSMALPADPDQLAKVPQPVTIHDGRFGATFAVTREGSDLFQSESQADAQGREVFRNTQKIAYVIGAGENGIGYIIRQGNYLFEAPLSYYTQTRTWELSPGFGQRDLSFTRPVTSGCIACHSGRAQAVPGGHGLYRDPPFRELAIGCETCHGPGKLHVEARMKGAPLTGAVDPMIVNPARLKGWLADNICMRCHQNGDARILKPGKRYSDFRPGTPLDETVSIFLIPFDRNAPPQEPLLQHYVLMILSKCYRASGGRLHCITCHDPHVQPSEAEAPAYFRKKCLECHTEKSCSVSLDARLRKNPPDDCIGCHMPKQNLRSISHSALTNHRIVANPTEPLPEAAFHLTTPQLPDLVHLDAVPGRPSAPLPPLILLKAYSDVMESHPAYAARYNASLDRAARSSSEDPYVLAALGRRMASEGGAQRKAEAVQLLSKSIQAGWTKTPDFALLAELLAESGRVAEGIAVLQRGIRVNPYDDGLYRMLVVQLADLRRYDEALAVVKQALTLFPQDSFMRGLLEKAEAPAAP